MAGAGNDADQPSILEQTAEGAAPSRAAMMVGRYEWDLDPEDARGPTIHGLRGTGILVRFAEGFDAGQIANDIGASRQTIEHYMRFRDQMGVAAAGRERLRMVDEG